MTDLDFVGQEMDRQQLVLAVLGCLNGKPMVPKQLQRAVFLVCHHFPELVAGKGFDFSLDEYGLLDSQIFEEAAALEAAGKVKITGGGIGRWKTYAATPRGEEEVSHMLAFVEQDVANGIREMRREASLAPHENSRIRRFCLCPEC